MIAPPQEHRPAVARSASNVLHDRAALDPHGGGFARIKKFAGPLLLILAGIAAMSVDVPLARWLRLKEYPLSIKKTFDLAEVFGHGIGVAGILIAVWVLAPHVRSKLPRVICAAYLSGLAANVLKGLVGRGRPVKSDLGDISGVFETFHGWLPFYVNGSAAQSFPSGHSATAVGLAVGLTWLLPRGKWLFATLAVFVAAQRLCSGYHYLSDTLWGAALGWLCAIACLPGGWLSPPLDRLEARLEDRPAGTWNDHESTKARKPAADFVTHR